jgi:hypothetical protein
MNQALNVSPSARFNHASGSTGPIAVIALGLIAVAAAVILALTVDTRTIPVADAGSATPPPAAPQPAQLAAADAAKDKAESKEELEPLPVELPNPVFAGTPTQVPKDVRVDRKRLGKRRAAFMAPKGLKNVALEQPVTSSDANPIIGSLDLVTDGDKEALDGRMVELAPGKQWVQIDLGKEHEVFAVVFWHNHMEPRVYRDVIVQVSNDPDFTEAKVVYNNDHDNSLGMGAGEAYEYFESDEGELAGVEAVKGRYVRLWSNGSTMDDQNHYSEVEVWGRPVK